MKKLFTILIVLFIAMGSNFVFAQESDITSVDEATLFPEGNAPKVAKEVAEGELTNADTKASTKKVQFDPKEKTPFEEFNKSVGVFAYAYPGLSWQQWIGGFGYQINFSGMYLPSEYVDYIDENYVSYDYIQAFYLFTAEAQFEFFTVKFLDDWHGRLYGVVLGGLYYSSDYNVPDIFNGIAGIGIGYETIYKKHLSFPLHFGYVCEFPNEFKMDFAFGAGFRFRF